VDWTVYWFMLPVCVLIATVAMFSGISGAALLTPTFLIGFPLLGVPRLTTLAAIGTSLLLETSGFGTGLYRYLSLRLVDVRTAKSLILVTLPLAAAGSIVSNWVPVDLLKIGYGVAMLGLALLLVSDRPQPPAGVPAGAARPGDGHVPEPAVVAESEHVHPDCPTGEQREISSASGHIYRFCAHGLRLQRVFSGAGAVVAGMISTGVGEATLPPLVRRSCFPVPVAAATSTVVVAGTVAGAAATHLATLFAAGGIAAIPWNLIVWAVPGAVAGAVIGTRLQGRVSEKAARLFFSGLFAAIGIAFLLAFTVFKHRFG
jgi:uncharacterized membrane protein YfcA